jgi:nucleoside diphosphate kinase
MIRFVGIFVLLASLKVSAMEQTFAIIKPDAVAAGHEERIIQEIRAHGFHVTQQKKIVLSIEQAQALYIDYKDCHWFEEVVQFMSSSSLIVLVLEKEQAIAEWRTLLGKSHPSKWGVLRKMFGTSHKCNALHGSASSHEAVYEISLFFEKE